MKRPTLLVALGLFAASGCGVNDEPRELSSASAKTEPAAPRAVFAEAAAMPGPALALAAPPAGPGGTQAAPVPAFQPASAVPRKIIYNADIAVTVERFAVAERALANLLKDYGGFVAQSDIAGSTGPARSGRWTVRVPAEQIDAFEDGVAALGDVQKRHRDSRDVTAEYFDTEARIKNKKLEEARLLKHLVDSTGNLKEILEIEREVARVRGEVEQLQGQLQLLANLSSLTTVTITLTERERPVPFVPPPPPRPPVVPTFAQRAGATYQASVDRLTELGETVALAVVAVAPWLPLLALGILIVWVVGRRLDPRDDDAPRRDEAMTIPRVLEPEAMDTPEEARDYDAMDHRAVNDRFVADFLAAHGPCRGGEILDVGTGTAQIPIALCRADPRALVVGLDLADAMLDLALRNVEAAGLGDRIRLVRGDGKGLDFPAGSFEAVISNTIIHHIPDPAPALAEMARLVAPGGTLLVRDLARPDSAAEVDRLVTTYAADESPHARALFEASLHAALSVGEVRELVRVLGLPAEGVAMTSDRHWTWTWHP